jgi:cytochrome b6-f complex subunit 4
LKRFYPDYLLEILFFVFLTVEIAIVLALLFPPSIGREIDFLSPYQPRPEWYYLWLFMLLRYFHGPWTVIGGLILPLIFMFIILFTPWIDRYMGRKTASVLIALLILFFIISLIIG